MLTTTTNNIEGKTILEYKGIIFGEVISGVDFFKDFAASVRDVFGGRSAGYEKELCEARAGAVAEMIERAENVGANAVIGVKVDYETIGKENTMMMVTASGTAVIVE